MKNFNINRFWQVLKWTVMSEKKSIITAFIAFTVGFLAIQLFSCFTIFDINHGLGPAATMAGMGTCAAILGFMAAYYASGILGNARTTQQRTTALMLPASNLEKFIARLIYCCIGLLIVLYLAALAATGLRMFLELIAGHDQITAEVGILFGYISPYGYDEQIENAISFGPLFPTALTLWSTSLFVLGGVFFRKRPFVWTNVTLFAGGLLLFTIIFYVCTLIGEKEIEEFLRPIFKDMMPATFFNWVSVFLFAFTALNVWLSYRLFSRLQVVQHKWFNL